MTASEKTWEACRSEIRSLLDEIDAPSSEIQGTKLLLRILCGHGGTISMRSNGRLEALVLGCLKLDAAERSVFCEGKCPNFARGTSTFLLVRCRSATSLTHIGLPRVDPVLVAPAI
jgi:hypothetical protein